MQTLPGLGSIHPDRLYKSAEVAEILHLHPDTVYRIPAAHLRRTRVGPNRGRTMVLGAHLIEYIVGKVA